MRKGKNNQKKAFSSIEENNNNNTNNNKKIPKEIGTFNGFLIYDKEEKIKESDLKDKINNFSEPPLKDWLIIQHNPNKKQSRFSDLFQEILQNDKKLEEQKKNKEKQSYEKSLLPNNIINDIEDDDEININENENEINIINEKNKIDNINDQMENINLNNNNVINEELNSNIINDINTNSINNINQNKFSNQINIDNNINDNNQNPNIINNNFSDINNINNSERINLNNIPNNNIINNNFPKNYNQKMKNNNNNFNSINTINYSDNNYQKFRNSNISNANPNSGFSSAAPTAPSSVDARGGLFGFMLNSSGIISDKNKMPNNNINNSINDYLYFSNKSSFYEPAPKQKSRPSEKKFDLNIDIKRIICLEDRRTTLMIKNIPNKFNRDLLLSIIDQNFKKAYDLFILPTDANRYKNFGYSFINFTSSYYIPYFYFLFNRKKWSSTNSQKVCEITYSKIQGRNNLLSHYPNKNIFKNEEAKKNDISEQKYIIPNEYFNIFNSAFPNYNIDKCENYFMTKMPFKY